MPEGIQDSNLQGSGGGGFQDLKVGLTLIVPPRTNQIKMGVAAITVINVRVQ